MAATVTRVTLITLMLLLTQSNDSAAQESPAGSIDAARELYDKAYELVLSEDWPEAAQRFRELAESRSSGGLLDDARFWLCYAIEKQGESTERAYRCYEELRDKFPDSEWADDAAASLVRIGRDLSAAGNSEYRADLKFMQDNDSDLVAVTAIHGLAEPGNNDVLPALRRVMEGKAVPPVRRAVVQALFKIDTAEARAFLFEIARTETDPRVQVEAVQALGSLSAAEAGDVLIEVLNESEHPEVQRAAVHALHRVGSAKAARALVGFLPRAANPSVVREAVFASADLDGTNVLPALRRLLRRTDALEVQLAAVQALHRLDSQAARRELIRVLRESSDPRLRREAAMALAEPEESAGVEVLTEVALGDPSPQVREVAAQALSRIGTPEARAALQEVLLNSAGGR